MSADLPPLYRWRHNADSPWRVTDWDGVPDPDTWEGDPGVSDVRRLSDLEKPDEAERSPNPNPVPPPPGELRELRDELAITAGFSQGGRAQFDFKGAAERLDAAISEQGLRGRVETIRGDLLREGNQEGVWAVERKTEPVASARHEGRRLAYIDAADKLDAAPSPSPGQDGER